MSSILSNWFKSSLTILSPRLNTEVIYMVKFHKRINLKKPKTLDEKIQWLKFHYYKGNRFVRDCVDKYLVREYIKSCGCSEILNELYGAYDTVDEIPWEKLPQQFVIKWNFGCGQNLICFDKTKFNIHEAKRKLKNWYRTRYSAYLRYSELQYQGIKPKLICEKLIETEHGGLPVDYKFYCFGGKAKCVLICLGRDSKGHKPKFYFFDRNWKLLRYNKTGKDAPEDFSIPKPKNIEILFDYAEKISKPFPFVRADFYLENGKATFGELTFTPCGGFDTQRLYETQILFGDMVNIDRMP